MIETFQAGGPVMYPLLICSLLTLGVVLERIYFWLRMVRVAPLVIAQIVRSATGKSRREQLLSLRIEAERTAAKLNRYQGLLTTMVSLAPLLGIFGTVLGIMGSFQILSEALAEGAEAAKQGLAQALLTTAFGLLIAMVSLVAHRVFAGRIARIRHEIEVACTRHELAIDNEASPAAP